MRVFFSAAISLGLILLGVWIGSFVFSVPNPAIADQEAAVVLGREGYALSLARIAETEGVLEQLLTLRRNERAALLETLEQLWREDGSHEKNARFGRAYM